MSDIMLSRVLEPFELPVTLDDVKAHARIEIAEDDLLVEGFIRSATNWAEWYTQRSLVTQEWELRHTKFPECGYITLPRPPLQELLSISYTNSSGDLVTVEDDVFTVIGSSGPTAGRARVVLNYSKSWPLTYRNQPFGIVLHYRAGYGDEERSSEFIPDLIKQGISVHVAEMYENRESTVLTGAVIQQVPFSVQNLLWPFVVDKFGI